MDENMNEIADFCRSEGNKFYSDRNFFDALVKYNESLCHSSPGSESMGLAYANRSAVYFEMKMFEKCLKNIEMAKSFGYPENKMKILENRIAKCAEEIKNGSELKSSENDTEEFLKLSYEAHDRVPFVVKCLEMKRSKNFGRFIVTNEDLKVGDILAIEEPHFKVLKSDSRYESCQEMNKYQRCAVCLKDNLMDLFPCPRCSSTMFCSLNCMKIGEETFHNFECDIIEILHKSGIMQMAMRIFFQALNMFDGSIEEMQKFLENFKNSTTSVYDFDFSSDKGKAKNFLASMFCLARSDDEHDSAEDSPIGIFKQHPFLCKIWNNHKKFVLDFFSRILRIGDSNFHGICGWSIQKYKNQDPQMIGIGCYPFISLVNHSCYPNVSRQYYQGNMMLVVERPIKKGEQLFDCYKSTFFTMPKIERQTILLQDYSFRCRCEACSKNFPLFHSLKSNDKKLAKIAKKEKNEMFKLDESDAIKKFHEICSQLQSLLIANEDRCPTSEIVLFQECLQKCLAIITKPKDLFP